MNSVGSIHKTWLFSPSLCRHHQGEYLSPRKCIINIRYFELMILGMRFIKLFASSPSGTSQLSVKRLGNRRDSHIKKGVSSSECCAKALHSRSVKKSLSFLFLFSLSFSELRFNVLLIEAKE